MEETREITIGMEFDGFRVLRKLDCFYRYRGKIYGFYECECLQCGRKYVFREVDLKRTDLYLKGFCKHHRVFDDKKRREVEIGDQRKGYTVLSYFYAREFYKIAPQKLPKFNVVQWIVCSGDYQIEKIGIKADQFFEYNKSGTEKNYRKPKSGIRYIPGDISNGWEILEIDHYDGKYIYYKCRCVCGCGEERILKGKEIRVTRCNMREEELQNFIKFYSSLEILQPAPPPFVKRDLTGEKINKLKVLGFSFYIEKGANSQRRYWLCQCDCGNKTVISEYNLLHSCIQSCGCMENIKYKDESYIGKRYGSLIVKEILHVDSHHGIFFKCKCDCGNTVIASATNIVLGRQKSCGCVLSKGEFTINEVLNKYNIPYESQKSFPDCRYKNLLRFDFCIYQGDEILALIEYQGEHHYKPSYFRYETKEEAEEDYVRVLERDQIKRDYCKEKGLRLVEISYKDYRHIEDILSKELGFQIKPDSIKEDLKDEEKEKQE